MIRTRRVDTPSNDCDAATSRIERVTFAQLRQVSIEDAEIEQIMPVSEARSQEQPKTGCKHVKTY
jgi:hypothetical protein